MQLNNLINNLPHKQNFMNDDSLSYEEDIDSLKPLFIKEEFKKLNKKKEESF